MIQLIKITKYQIIIFAVALALGSALSNYTAQKFSKTATQLMGIVTGSRPSLQKKVDFNKIPQVFYPRLGEKVYFPLFIATRALVMANKMENNEDNKEEYKKYFLKYIEWLKDNLVFDSYQGMKYAVWEHSYPYPYGIYDLKIPWRCGMAQGEGLSVFSKAFEITGDPTYLEYAKYMLNSFFVEVKHNGVTYKDSDKEWWYEEYPGSKNGSEPRVLNGAIYTVIDIFDFYKKTGNEDAKILFQKGSAAIKKRLSRYDTGEWTYYDEMGHIATLHYHQDHIRLTKKMYDMTKDPYFLEYSKKWAGYKTLYFPREFIHQRPDYQDIVILGLNVAICMAVLNLFTGMILLIKKLKKSRL